METTPATEVPTNPQKLRPAIFTTVEQLKPSSSGHNLILKVVSCNVVVDKSRPDGTKLRIAEAVVGDSTGTIILTARNSQIDVVVPGKTIVVRNAKIEMFKGFMRLSVDKWGNIRPSDAADFEVNMNNNMSLVEYELVPVSNIRVP